MKTKYIDIDKITSIRFTPVINYDMVFIEGKPAKKFLGITYQSEQPSGWAFTYDSHVTFKAERRFKCRPNSFKVDKDGLFSYEDLFYNDENIMRKARLDITIDGKEIFYEYFASDKQAQERINQLQKESKANLIPLK